MLTQRIAIFISTLFTAAILLSTNASATIVNLSGTHSRGQVKKDCAAIGGVSSSNGGSYSCENPKNGNRVDCYNNGKCFGTVNRQGKPGHTISGILHPPSGNKSGGNAPSKIRHHRVDVGTLKPHYARYKRTNIKNHPVTVIQNDEQHHSGHR